MSAAVETLQPSEPNQTHMNPAVTDVIAEPKLPEDDLPSPWIRQFDESYQTYFYVNPSTQPPTITWTHPGFQEGQIAPDQENLLKASSGGSAAEYLGSAPNDQAPNQVHQGSDTELPPSGDGSRGMGSKMAMNLIMGGLGGNKHGNNGGYNQGFGGQSKPHGAMGMATSLLNQALSGGKHHNQGYNSGPPGGPPPFMNNQNHQGNNQYGNQQSYGNSGQGQYGSNNQGYGGGSGGLGGKLGGLGGLGAAAGALGSMLGGKANKFGLSNMGGGQQQYNQHGGGGYGQGQNQNHNQQSQYGQQQHHQQSYGQNSGSQYGQNY